MHPLQRVPTVWRAERSSPSRRDNTVCLYMKASVLGTFENHERIFTGTHCWVSFRHRTACITLNTPQVQQSAREGVPNGDCHVLRCNIIIVVFIVIHISLRLIVAVSALLSYYCLQVWEHNQSSSDGCDISSLWPIALVPAQCHTEERNAAPKREENKSPCYTYYVEVS